MTITMTRYVIRYFASRPHLSPHTASRQKRNFNFLVFVLLLDS